MQFDWFTLDWVPSIQVPDWIPRVDWQAGLSMAIVVAVLVVSVRFLIAWANARDSTRGDESPLREALERTGNWTYGLIAGAFGAGALGLMQFGDIVGHVLEFVVSHPYFASNVAIGGLGAGGIGGWIPLTASQYAGIAMMVVGAVFLFTEVDDAV
ncbi:hypothetical protein BRC92_00345 [Halobacteriales archaeon QS_4_69_31]|nr:MAG: hypothetical protein BRC92_00345 [Halobacteriales archaeon QS_4_69_31]